MYKSPKACYKKAPVRRETYEESLQRQVLQVPTDDFFRAIVRMKEQNKDVNVTVNEGLVPGKPMFYKEVTRV